MIHDDFLKVGGATTDEEAEIDHDKNSRNFRLNAEKTKLKMTEAPYIGHLLTHEGLRVGPQKVEAIEKSLKQRTPKLYRDCLAR